MFLILDLETTGLHADKGDGIIDIAAYKVAPDGTREAFQAFVHPGTVHLSDFVLALTGIPKDTLLTAPSWEEVKAAFLTFLGDTPMPIVGHNVGFDIHFLQTYGVDLSAYPVVDTNDWATFFVPEAKSHSLEVLAEGFGIDHELKHTALGDVAATYALLQIMRARFVRSRQDMLPAITKLRALHPYFSGWLFFDLTFPELAVLPDFHVHTLPSHGDAVPVAKQSGALHIVPRMLGREAHLMSIFGPGVYIVPASHLASYHSMPDVCVVDRLRSFVSLSTLARYLQEAEPTDAGVLLLLRMATTWEQKSCIHAESEVLTHNERRILGRCSMEHDPTGIAVLSVHLTQFPVLVTTHQTYFGDETQQLFANVPVVVDEYAMLEHYLYNVARQSLGMEYFQQVWTQLLQQLTDQERTQLEPELFALSNTVRYFFTNLAKLMGGRHLLPRDDAHDMVRQFVHTFHRGSTLLLDRLPESKQHTLLYLQRLIMSLLDEQDDRCVYYFYVQMGNVMIIRERGSMEEYLQLLGDREVYYVDTRLLPHFPYLHPVTTVGETQDQYPTNVDVVSQDMAKRLERDDDQAVLELTNPSQKNLLVGGGIKMERLFDILYTHFAQTACYVGMYGKSGGKGKILSRYHLSNAAMVIQSWKDVYAVPLAADVVLILQLPFTVFAGQYFAQQYGQQSFGILTLPLCIKQIRDLIDEVTARSPRARVMLADPRLRTKGYGQDILDACGVSS